MKYEFSLTEERYRAFDITAKIIGGIGAILLLLVGYWQFKALYTKEFDLKFYSEKIEYLVRLNGTIGMISSDDIDEDSLIKGINDFKKAWYIKNVFIEDEDLLSDLYSFDKLVDEIRPRIKSKKNKSDSTYTIRTANFMMDSKDVAESFAVKTNKILKDHIKQ